MARDYLATVGTDGNIGGPGGSPVSPSLTGFALAAAAVVATTNLTLSGFQTIDGYTTLAADRVLLTGQTIQSQNGVWAAASGSWSRPTDFASGAVFTGSRTVQIINGTANGHSTWLLATNNVTVDTTAQGWQVQIPGGAVGLPAGTGNAGGPILRDFVSAIDFGADLTGNTDSTVAIQNALNEAAARLSGVSYAPNQGVKCYLPGGNYSISSRLRIPKGVKFMGDGPRSTVILPTTPFNDNCVIGPGVYNQEFFNVEGMSIWGSNGSGFAVQTNGGGSTTFAGSTFTPATTSFPLQLTSAAGWATTGYALVNGISRVIYDGISGNTLQNCWITSGTGPVFTNGVTVAPITTNNVNGLFIPASGAVSAFRDLEIESCGAECLLVCGIVNCTQFENLWVQKSNMDSILLTAAPNTLNLSQITAQSCGNNGTVGTFACLHVFGTGAGNFFQGSINIDNLYMESNVADTIGLWIQDIGGVSVNGVRLIGGSNFSGQVCVQIDSSQTNPTKQDGLHSSNISLRNISTSHVNDGSGRTLLIDNVRGVNSGSNSTAPASITRYDTEDTNPGVLGFFKANQFYWAGSFIVQQNSLYIRNTTGVSGVTFTADAINWTLEIGAGLAGEALADRERALRLAGLTFMRETVDGAAFAAAPISSTQTCTSGTQVGARIPVLTGESYAHVAFRVGSTAATWGTNNDGHWYVAIYDVSGNLVHQTADQGHAGLLATAVQRIAIPTIAPVLDALYTAVVMVYVGTGGSPVAPTMSAAPAISTGSVMPGMPAATITANAGQTTGTAPGTLGSTSAGAAVPWIALYT